MTNEEFIKQLSTKQLAVFLNNGISCVNICDDFGAGCSFNCVHNNGVDEIERWLKTEII